MCKKYRVPDIYFITIGAPDMCKKYRVPDIHLTCLTFPNQYLNHCFFIIYRTLNLLFNGIIDTYLLFFLTL